MVLRPHFELLVLFSFFTFVGIQSPFRRVLRRLNPLQMILFFDLSENTVPVQKGFETFLLSITLYLNSEGENTVPVQKGFETLLLRLEPQ